ncbi:Quaternary ammonium compound-resistance protein sugE [Cedecea neteri]|uniref:Guanidinium exporter n=1 Tax=Cedecea neteri TaxID=158822 RepID=A0A2X2T764_9ENTR|nr:Quaternary ammonium compound-resistance protein sugE [Cedecea neteri]
MAWIVLFIAGLLEVVWAVGLKYTHGFSRLWPSVITIIAMVVSMALLAWAMKTLPTGTAYAVWTGIGAVGAAITGILLLGESANPMRLASLALIVVGIIGPETFHALTARLFHPNQFIHRKALTRGDSQELLFDVAADGWRAGEDPQIAEIRPAHQRVAILFIQRNDVVAAVERAKEGDF